jgi:hypothetical protein
MRLYERFADQGYHTTIMTSFSVDFDAYESIVLPRLRGAGSYNNFLLVDAGMLTDALSGTSAMPKYAGIQYSIFSASAKGVFHPKVVFQVGRDKGRLIVGSANTTVSGLAGNLEVVGSIDCNAEKSGEQTIITDCWNYLRRFMNTDGRSLEKQLDWMLARTPWLQERDDLGGLQVVSDGSMVEFLATGAPSGMLSRLLDLVGTESVEHITVTSPYWDPDLGALKTMIERLGPEEVRVLIDPDREMFPAEALHGLAPVTFYDIRKIAGERFSHAKLIIVGTQNHDHVLFGSANCTIAALGNTGFSGKNEEACFYRRLKPREILTELGLDRILSETKPLNPADIRPLRLEDEVTNEQVHLNPGLFYLQYGTLVWRPSPMFIEEKVDIELFDTNERVIDVSLEETKARISGERNFALSSAGERPAFARVVVSDGKKSTLAIINMIDALLSECRERGGRQSERNFARLAGEEEEGLWLLEILDSFESAAAGIERNVSSKPRKRTENAEEEGKYEVLGYSNFVSGCRLRSEGHGIGRNSLAGTEFSYVRGFINRVLDCTRDFEVAGEEGEEAAQKLISGSEADNIDEVGDEQLPPEIHINLTKSVDQLEEDKRSAIQKKQNQDQIVKAVNGFIDRIRERRTAESLSSVDVLRLRAMLTILAAAGWGEDSAMERTSLQVLPPDHAENGWPRLIGKVLFAVFGGNKPAINVLQVDEIYDQIPDDLFECWSCCFWTIQACIQASDPKSSPRFEKIAGQIYTETRLSSEQLLSDAVVNMMELMSKRFADRLGLDASLIRSEHERYSTLPNAADLK